MTTCIRAALALLVSAGLGLAQERGEVPAEAYAIVDGVPIARAQVDEAAEAAGYPPAAVLESMIRTAALEGGLRGAGADPSAISAERIAAEREELAEEWGADEVAKIEDEALRLRIAFYEHVDAQIDEPALRAYYEERKLRLDGELRARHVQFPATAQGLAAAQEALAQLGEAPTDAQVDQLARERSIDPFAPVNGGDLDWFGPDGRTPLGLQIPRSLVSACFELGQPGVVPYPVPSRQGYHLLRVIAVRVHSDGGFEAAAPRLRRSLRRELMRRTEQRWRDAAAVVYAPDAPRFEQR